mmetsp:Transcript_181627/g.576401  ORF Transcript_181627/g.576401 Transcript_181627/m.576401 type:complete len:90 (-) Transcript_181627:34-303(-)
MSMRPCPAACRACVGSTLGRSSCIAEGFELYLVLVSEPWPDQEVCCSSLSIAMLPDWGLQKQAVVTWLNQTGVIRFHTTPLLGLLFIID